MLSIKRISIACSILALSLSSVHAGQWSDLMNEGKGEEAKARAKFKYDNYRHRNVADYRIDEITNYINKYLPYLNTDVVSFGITEFFKKN
jgi:hypothetical protein